MNQIEYVIVANGYAITNPVTPSDDSYGIHLAEPTDLPDGCYSEASIRLGSPAPYFGTDRHPDTLHNAVDGAPVFTTSIAVLKALTLSMAVKDLRYCLKGVNVNPAAQRLEASDGCRALTASCGIDKDRDADLAVRSAFIIPGNAIKLMIKYGLDTVSHIFTTQYVATGGKKGIKVYFREIDGKYPSIDRVTPKDDRIVWPIDAVAVGHVASAHKLAKSKWDGMRFSQTDDTTEITVGDQTVRIKSNTPVGEQWPDVTGFSTRYLTDLQKQGFDLTTDCRLIGGRLLAVSKTTGMRSVVIPMCV